MSKEMDKIIRKDKGLNLKAQIFVSGTWLYIGEAPSPGDPECIFIADDETIREPIYMSVNEARLYAQSILAIIHEIENP